MRNLHAAFPPPQPVGGAGAVRPSATEGSAANVAFDRFRRQLAALTGIEVAADRQYLVEARLAPIMRARDIGDFPELLRRFERRESEALVREIIEAMTTSETSFFRDRAPFDVFRDQTLPELMATRATARRLRIWCAACSSGQEAYSLAMTLDQSANALRGWSVELLATDISQTAIDAARAGAYSQFEVQRGLSTTQLLRYFQRQGDGWRVNEHIRARIVFQEFNLLSNLDGLGKFDAIFCRNVLLYFDPETRRDVLARLSRALADDGCLFLGASELAGERHPAFAAPGSDGVLRLRGRPRPQLRLAHAV
jgi:chemotaxis protein methyltransferase CheR